MIHLLSWYFFVSVISLCLSSEGLAQDIPMTRLLPSADTILARQKQLELSSTQVEAIRSTVRKTQKEFESLQVTVEREDSRFRSLLSRAEIDEKEVVNQLKILIKAEEDLKLLQVRTLVRINSILTSGQRRMWLETNNKAASETKKELESLIIKIRQLAGKRKNINGSFTQGEIKFEEKVRIAERFFRQGEYEQARRLLSRTLKELQQKLESDQDENR